MRRPDPTYPSGLEGILPYALVGVFTVLFWGATLFLWRQACLPPVECTPPNFALTIFALPLPFLGYWALMHAPSAAGRRFNALTYIGIEVFALIFWAIAVWLWLQAFIWYAFVVDITFVAVFLFMLLPYVAVVRSIASPGAPPAAPRRADAPPSSGAPQGNRSFGWLGDWIRWMGAPGHAHHPRARLLDHPVLELAQPDSEHAAYPLHPHLGTAHHLRSGHHPPALLQADQSAEP